MRDRKKARASVGGLTLMALLQVDKAIRQTVVGLTPGQQHWLQFYYDVRNCCGGTIDLSVKFDGVELDSRPQISPVGAGNPYHFHHVAFTPANKSGVLEFSTISSGDATALLDGISIVKRESNSLLIRNPSFEASGVVPWPGCLQPANMAGWTSGGGGRGVNVSGAGPFADIEVNPDQDSVLFLQGAGDFISQTISGFTAGQNDTLTFAANARLGHSAKLRVTFGSQTILEENITAAGGANPYAPIRAVFAAQAAEEELRFEQVADGDNTVLIDNAALVPGGQAPVNLKAQRLANGSVRVSWLSSVTGFGLQFTRALPGGWVDSTVPVNVEGDEFVVLEQPVDAATFYRLRK